MAQGWFECGDADHPCNPILARPSPRCCVGLAFGNNLGGPPNGQMALFGGQTGSSSCFECFNGESWLWDKVVGWHCVVHLPATTSPSSFVRRRAAPVDTAARGLNAGDSP